MMNEFKVRFEDTLSSRKFDNQLPEQLCPYLDWAGIGNPFAKIYVTTSNMKFFPMFLSLFTLFQLLKLQRQKNTGTELAWNPVSFCRQIMFHVVFYYVQDTWCGRGAAMQWMVFPWSLVCRLYSANSIRIIDLNFYCLLVNTSNRI